ncbi:sigma-54-dependent transcriptional regulator [Niabella hibiscisoli]|uniref:sigma-54-dependent transcriptional regulator n=1 Tax=Niabella hibiscisoli TaxID=1825928 RepID=UPI001F108440|nr:sigma-54 dependent transcriptional regulator [Niabella hibiscisoli]MCH5718762.1 sigma-54 dependent transcriptional regulator [Niabella hibiscisoli]
MKRILIIDDDPSTCNLLASFLKKHHYLTDTSLSGKEALNLLQEKKFDLIFCDYILTDIRGKEMFEKIKRIQPKATVIFITGHASVQIAVDLMKAGAFYYLEKPLFPEKILELMQYAFESSEATESSFLFRAQQDSDAYVKGIGSASEMLYSNVSLIAPTNYSVIICGETGTGKERLARQIHLESKRAQGPFIAVDCGSLSKELAASELFGHEKGAFTGAVQNKTGAFEMADGGTLFLDEIGNLSYDVQAMLLRSIQEKHIRKVGGSQEKPVNTRIIVASNKNLYNLVREQKFREDLFHRLNEFTIIIPPLKERTEDLALFVDYFISIAEKELDKKYISLPRHL